MGFKSEFKPSMVKLNHERAKDFAESPWMPWYVLVTYRIILAVVCLVVNILSLTYIYGSTSDRYFIFLTNWGFLFVTVYFILSSVVTLWYHLKEQKKVVVPSEMEMERMSLNPSTNNPERREEIKYDFPPRGHHKALWVIYEIGAGTAILITIFYWTLLAPDLKISLRFGLVVIKHAFNSVLMLLELVLTSMPIRILHVIYPIAFAITYMLFSVIYWAAGGTNPNDNKRYIYPNLDYTNNPGLAVGLFVGIIFAMPLVQLFLYGMYRLREFVAAKHGRSDQQ